MPLDKFREKRGNSKPWVGVGIDIVSNCNLKCRQCFYENGLTPIQLMPFDKVKLVIQKTAGKFSEIYILGGEPTLHPDIGKILAACLEKFEEVILVTNGVKLAEENFCRQLALPNLKIAMHRRAIKPSAQELVDYLARRKGAFQLYQRAWRNVEKFWQGDICVQANILKPLAENGHLMDVFQWARNQGYEPVIELTKPGPVFERGNELDVPSAEIHNLYQAMLDYDRVFFGEKADEIVYIVPPSYGHNCTLVETSIHVRVDGKVVPCVSHANLPLGNIFTDDLDGMLNSPLRKAIMDYRTWIVGPCQNCSHFEFCHGGCRGEAFWDTGCPRASDPYCWHLPEGLKPKDFVPETCAGCILEKNQECNIRTW